MISNFDKMDRYKIEDKQGLFFQGQIFDAYAKFESFIAEAEKEIVLTDNYVNLTVLERFAKKKSGVKVRIYTYPKTKITSLDIQKFNEKIVKSKKICIIFRLKFRQFAEL